jgi:hypothetical protein
MRPTGRTRPRKPAMKTPQAGGGRRKSGPRRAATGGEAGAGAGVEQPRYGGGSPGRRGYDVGQDWGGGAGRGKTGNDRAEPERGGGARRGSTSRGGSRSEMPRGDVGGRSGQSRTTGSGGGIGASGAGDYRVKGRGGRSR